MIEEWRRQLTEFERKILHYSFDTWHETGTWPRALPIAVTLRKEVDYYKTADTLGNQFIIVGTPHAEDHPAKLTILGIALCEGSEVYLQKYIDIINYSLKRYIENPGKITVTADEIKQECELSTDMFKRICELISDDYSRWARGATIEDNQYSYQISYSILKFEGIKTFNDYLEIVDKRWLPTRFGGEREEAQTSITVGDTTTEEQVYQIPSLEFMMNPLLKDFVTKDLEELIILIQNKAWKSVSILSGSILEFILFDHFLNNEQLANRVFKNKWPSNISLSDLINQAEQTGLISNPDKHIYELLRLYRNLIHPNLARTEQRPDEYVAYAITNFVFKIIRDMNEKK